MGRSRKRKDNKKDAAAADDAPPAAEPAATKTAVEAPAAPPPASGAEALPPPALLGLIAFISGGVLMGLEIVGSRVLAPHFGNSVFIWGSLISVFLTSLSAGYYAGGMLADRHPSFRLLNAILMSSGVLILFVPFWAHGFCRTLIGAGWEERSGPLAAATVLFLPPSVLMGMVSPFAVRLAARAVDTVGRTAGGLYALSTGGSIVGTLTVTFLLIPSLATSTILKSLGLTLALTGGVFLVWQAIAGRRAGAALVALVLGGVAGVKTAEAAPPSWPVQVGEDVLVDEDTPYHHIMVVDRDYENQRILRFDKYVESSIKLYPPWPSTSLYTDYFHLALLLRPEADRSVFIGAGGGIGPRTYHALLPDMHIDVVDIDGRILEIAVEHFHMPDVPEIEPHARDGRVFLMDQAEDAPPYDILVLDAFTIGGRIPFHLVSQEYFDLCRDRLADEGVFMMNINSALKGSKAEIFRSVTATLKEVFAGEGRDGHIYVFAKGWSAWGSPKSSRNVILVATKGGPLVRPAEWAERARDYDARPRETGITRRTVEGMVRDLVWPLPEVEGATVLTDDFAPIETMPF